MPLITIEDTFPNIGKEGFRITSEETSDYNCFAWAMGDKSQWWSPSNSKGYYWHSKVEKDLSVKSFCELYKHEGGYLPCDNEKLEKGFEKIVIYADASGNVTHVEI